ncbi:MAG: dihydrodipicolinate synthase family protein [Clostridia bacterium]|nr:dihydrodipicolinate synthase family protein [Clostridia bacterium]
MKIAHGIYPTMLVAYTPEGKIDYPAMGELIEWYIQKGVHGIFALCQSTEIAFLSLEERLSLGKFIIEKVNGRVPVVMSGMTADTLEGQIEEAKQIARLKPAALVLLSNRIDDDAEHTLTEKIQILLSELPEELPLGIYEIPVPYKRLITDEELTFMANSGRFAFIKDTCCDVSIMRRRAEIVRGLNFGLFNANAATILDTLRFGYAGFSGIMANIHPSLYVWLYENSNHPLADRIIHYIAMTSVIEARCYPIIAKRYLREYEGLSITDVCRSAEDKNVPAVSYELRAVHELTHEAWSIIRNNSVSC